MPNQKSRLRSELPNLEKLVSLLTKVAEHYADGPTTRVVFEVGANRDRFNASECDSVVIDPSLDFNNIQFGRPPLSGGKETSKVTCVADTGAFEVSSITAIADTGAKATGALDLTADITLTKALMGTAENTHTFTLQILAAAANPAATVLAAFTGTAAAITLTITPNDGTNNTLTPVGLTTAQVAELINTGAVAGKTITLTDASSLRAKQTAAGGDTTVVVDSGEGDGVVATFAAGANSNLNSKYLNFSDATDAHKYYLWLNVNGEGVDPTVATRTGVPLAIAAGASANTIATAARAAIGALGSSAYFTTGGSSAVCTITNKKVGTSTDTADGTAATGFTISTTTQGHASNLNSKAFTVWTAEDAAEHSFYYTVNSEGVDPAAGGTSHAIAIAAGASANTIATATAAVVGPVTGLDATASNASRSRIPPQVGRRIRQIVLPPRDSRLLECPKSKTTIWRTSR